MRKNGIFLGVMAIAVAGLAWVAAPAPAAAGYEHCHSYSSGFQCDHSCSGMEVCCTPGYDCGEA
jgi:hypothetical protein